MLTAAIVMQFIGCILVVLFGAAVTVCGWGALFISGQVGEHSGFAKLCYFIAGIVGCVICWHGFEWMPLSLQVTTQ